MFQPLELFIGLRYLRSRRWQALVSFRTAASLLGLALGVTALIVILSVLNGLEAETRSRLLELSAQSFGPVAPCVVRCPACEDTVVFPIDLRALLVTAPTCTGGVVSF